MAIRDEVFGRCVEEIDVSVEIKNVVVWLCCGLIYLGFVLAGKAAKDWCRDGARYWRRFLMLWASLKN